MYHLHFCYTNLNKEWLNSFEIVITIIIAICTIFLVICCAGFPIIMRFFTFTLLLSIIFERDNRQNDVFLLKWWDTRHGIRLIQNPGIQCVGRYWKYGYFVYNWRQLFLAGYRIISGYPAFSIIGYLAEYHQAFHIRHPARYRKGPDYSAGCLVSRISGVGYPCMLKNPLAKNGIPAFDE